MKRDFDGLMTESISPSPSIADFSQYIQDMTLSPTIRHKRTPVRRFTPRAPSSLIPSQDSEPVADHVKSIFNHISSSCATRTVDANTMDIDGNKLRFVFFLGVQGKEYIDIIRDKFISMTSSHPTTQILFISSNFEPKANDYNHFPISTNPQCLHLVNAFKIKDPLGGGLYPLDYLYVIDKEDLVRCKIPIIINSHSNRLMGKNSHRNRQLGGLSNHLNFGVELEQLPGFVEEYITYFHS